MIEMASPIALRWVGTGNVKAAAVVVEASLNPTHQGGRSTIHYGLSAEDASRNLLQT